VYEGIIAFAAIVIAPLVLVWLFARSVFRNSKILDRIDHGLCKGCGYDLRSSEGNCPECGRPFQPHEKVKLRTDE
jgi:predicted amidophosphoribosyltransferase